MNFLLVLISSGIFCCVPTILLGLSGRGGGCFAMILAVSVHNNRTSVFLLSGNFHWMGGFIGKHFLGSVLQDLLGCSSFGYGGPACQELWSLCPIAAEQVGPGALVFTWLFKLPGECSSSLLETIWCVWLLPKHALRTSGLLFQPLKAFFLGPRCSFMVSIIEFGPYCLSLPRAVSVS